MTSKARQAAERRGRQAETWAVWLLRLKGYRILARRYKSPVGEIDLIAAKKNLLVFVEVKARPSLREALESLTNRQLERISRAAAHYLSQHQMAVDCRYDAIIVAKKRLPLHLKNAWTATNSH